MKLLWFEGMSVLESAQWLQGGGTHGGYLRLGGRYKEKCPIVEVIVESSLSAQINLR